MSPAKRIALCAILAALGVGILVLASLYPPVAPALAAAAGLLGAIAVIHCGIGWSLGVYAVCGGLALLLCPTKSVVVFYLLYFGWYPVVKSLLERIRSRALCWILKLAVAAVGIGAAYYVYYRLFATNTALPWYMYVGAFVLCLACFVGYDLAFSLLISYYNRKIAPNIKL